MNTATADRDQNCSESEYVLLAWAGWQLQMPADWRPLKLFGDPGKGSMIVGDAVCACFSIHWQQSRRAISDSEEWARGRLKRLGLLSDPMPPAAERFSACAWANGVQSEEGKKTTHWYGYAARAKLLLGVKVNGVLPQHQRDLITQHVLPSLDTSSTDAETTWAMYGLSFRTPAGFKLVNRHLFAGDVALSFRKNRQESLLLRQVYPGDLALERRGFERWLSSNPFVEHRRFSGSSSPWRHPHGEHLVGVRRRGFKRLAFPLGRLMPRWNHALAVHDQRQNRLLIAEHSSAGEPDDKLCEGAILGMSQSLVEGH